MRAAWLLGAALALTIAAPATAGFPQHVDATVHPGGTLSETSSALPKDAKSATITVEPKASDEGSFFSNVHVLLAATPSKRDRVLLCVGFYKLFTQGWGHETEFELPGPEVDPEPELALLFLKACLEIAFQNQPAKGRSAATSCPSVPLGVPMRVSHESGGYRITVKGVARKPTRRRVRVSCTRVGGAMKLKLRPRSRTRSLRSVVGRKLAIGFYNTSERKPVRMRTTFSVRR